MDAVIPTANAVDAILLVKPAVFVKGIDYANGLRFTENIRTACSVVGAQLRFTTTPKLSADELIDEARARSRL